MNVLRDMGRDAAGNRVVIADETGCGAGYAQYRLTDHSRPSGYVYQCIASGVAPTPSPNNTIPKTLYAKSGSGSEKENDNILIIIGIVFLFFLISALD